LWGSGVGNGVRGEGKGPRGPERAHTHGRRPRAQAGARDGEVQGATRARVLIASGWRRIGGKEWSPRFRGLSRAVGGAGGAAAASGVGGGRLRVDHAGRAGPRTPAWACASDARGGVGETTTEGKRSRSGRARWKERAWRRETHRAAARARALLRAKRGARHGDGRGTWGAGGR
jgi:hypothetical protein